MLGSIRRIGGRECRVYDCGASDVLLIQPVDDHDIEVLDSEASEIVRLAGGAGFTLAAFRVNDWNSDLSPWEAPAVFGSEGFAAVVGVLLCGACGVFGVWSFPELLLTRNFTYSTTELYTVSSSPLKVACAW